MLSSSTPSTPRQRSGTSPRALPSSSVSGRCPPANAAAHPSANGDAAVTLKQAREQAWARAQSVRLSVDLVAGARQYLGVLRAVNAFPALTGPGPVLDRAISRYTRCWLPLLWEEQRRWGEGNTAGRGERTSPERGRRNVDEGCDGHGSAKKSPGLLVPPLDVLWVWVCHRLNPLSYAGHCHALFGAVLDCPRKLLELELSRDRKVVNTLIARTAERWSSRFEEPFEMNLLSAPAENSAGGGFGGFSEWQVEVLQGLEEELGGAVMRQAPFIHQVCEPHFWEAAFLQTALERYKGFLHLIKVHTRGRPNANPAAFFVPTYDIDVMWHTHQLCPSAYAADSKRVLGRVLDHDDRDQDRSRGSKLTRGYNGTVRDWERLFRTTYPRAGCMYRGPAPPLLSPMPAPLWRQIQTKYSKLSPLSLLTLPPPRGDEGLGPWGSTTPGHAAPSPASGGSGGRPPVAGRGWQPAPGGRGPSHATRHGDVNAVPIQGPAPHQDRFVFHAVVVLRGMNQGPCGGNLGRTTTIEVQTLSGIPGVLLRAKPFSPLALWPVAFATQFTTATRGLRFSLAFPGKVLGTFTLEWQDIWSSPNLAIEGAFPLLPAPKIGCFPFSLVPEIVRQTTLLISVSVTAPRRGASLLALLPSFPVDASGEALTYRRRKRERGALTPGDVFRRTRTAVDHCGKERFVLLLHRGVAAEVKGKGFCVEGGPDDWKSVTLREGRWLQYPASFPNREPLAPINCTAGKARMVRSWNNGLTHEWNLGPWALIIAFSGAAGFPLSLSLLRSHSAGSARSPSAHDSSEPPEPVALVPGRVLEYSVDRNSPTPSLARGAQGVAGGGLALEDGEMCCFVTLVRFPREVAARGRAMAVMNFRTGVVEAHPDEDSTLVLLLCAVLGVSVPILEQTHCSLAHAASADTPTVRFPSPVPYVWKWKRAALRQKVSGQTKAEWGALSHPPWYSYSDADWYSGTQNCSLALAETLHDRPYSRCGAGVCGSFRGGVCGGDGRDSGTAYVGGGGAGGWSGGLGIDVGDFDGGECDGGGCGGGGDGGGCGGGGDGGGCGGGGCGGGGCGG